MYKNIGKTLMDLAAIITAFGVILSGVAALIIWFGTGYWWGISRFWMGLIVFIGGSLSAWICSFFVYGFGQLVSDTARMAGPENKKEQVNSEAPEF